MWIGAHVRAGGDLVGALERAHEVGAEVVQVFTQSPRAWKPTEHAPAVLERYRSAVAADRTVRATFCHATYLINLAATDPDVLARSRACLVANLSAAYGMGASGLVLHLGSHRGRGFDRCVGQVVDGLLGALEAAEDPVAGAPGAERDPAACPILLENAAGAGDTVGRTFEELAAVLDLADAGGAIGTCLDTQHLWASGVGYGSPKEADAVVRGIDETVGLGSLRCLHLNDSKVPLGANRDRHENLGRGAIGETALACLLGHPSLDGLFAVLEVPGDGHGPRRDDLRAARRILRIGRQHWADAPQRELRRAALRPHAGGHAAGGARAGRRVSRGEEER
jgi:deoxyribonuclease-4